MKNIKKQKTIRRKIRSKGKLTLSHPRLVAFKSLSNNYLQLVDDKQGKTLVGTSDLKIKKGTKMEKAKEVGIAIAKMAKELKVDQVVFDRNGNRYHGRVKAMADGAREGGLKF